MALAGGLGLRVSFGLACAAKSSPVASKRLWKFAPIAKRRASFGGSRRRLTVIVAVKC